MPRNFEEDLSESNKPIIKQEWERIIKEKFGEKSQIVWKDSNEIQKGIGADLTVITEKGRRYSIETKLRRCGCNSEWIMEIISHIYDQENKDIRKKLYSQVGWIYTTTAEYILHGTLNQDKTKITEAIFYSLIPFKTQAWKSEFSKYSPLWLTTLYPNGNFQLTLNKLIPVEIIKLNALEFWKWN